jgi:hypothetical protein
VRKIIVFDNFKELVQAGDDVGRIWKNYRNAEGNFHKQSIAVFQRYGASCPSAGCGRCGFTDCFFSEFIGITGIVRMATEEKSRVCSKNQRARQGFKKGAEGEFP